METKVRSINKDMISRKGRFFGVDRLLIIMTMHCWAELGLVGIR